MIDRILRVAVDIGWATTVQYGFARVLAHLSAGSVRLYKYRLTAQPVLNLQVTPPRRGLTISVREAPSTEARLIDFGRPLPVIDQRLRNGCRCLVAHRGAQLVGFQWFTTQDYSEDEVRCTYELRPEDRCAWDFDIFVVPEARTQPVFSRLWDECNRILRGSGIDLSLSRIDAFNSRSMRAHARLGALDIGSALFLIAGRWQLALLPVRPHIHLSWSLEDIPRLAVSRLARARLTEAPTR